MNLRDLGYIVAVSELRSFSQAAERCHISQPTLSCQIKKVEELLGVKIFERSNRHVMLTDVGKDIVHSSQKILQEVERMKEYAQLAHDPSSGTFKLGAFQTLSTYIFPSLVPHIKESFPKLKLVLMEEKTEAIITKLMEGKLDAALLALPVEHDQLQYAPIFDDPFKLAVPKGHALATREFIDDQDIHNLPLLLLEEGHCLRDQALDYCHAHGVSEQDDVRATGLETLRQMVIAGTGVTLMPDIATSHYDKDIHYISFRTAPKRTIGLVWRKSSTRTEVIAQLTELLQSQYGNLPIDAQAKMIM